MSTDRARYTLSVKDAAAYLDVAVSTLYGIAERGEIDHLRTTANVRTRIVNGAPKTYRKHGRLKFSQAGLDAWIDAHRVTVTTAKPRPAVVPSPLGLPEPARRRFA